MRSLEQRLMLVDGLSIDASLLGSVLIEGNIDWPQFDSDAYPRLSVKKVLEIFDDGLVETRLYSYHACVRGLTFNADIFRYDNSHPHPSHYDSFHAHWLADGKDEIVWIGQHRWPELGSIIELLDEWWREDGQRRKWT